MKKQLFPKPAYTVEPDEPIETVEEMLDAVRLYFKKQDKEIAVVKADKVSIILLEGKQYAVRTDKFVGLMGGGRSVQDPHPVRYFGGAPGNVGGYKFIHIYLCDE